MAQAAASAWRSGHEETSDRLVSWLSSRCTTCLYPDQVCMINSPLEAVVTPAGLIWKMLEQWTPPPAPLGASNSEVRLRRHSIPAIGGRGPSMPVCGYRASKWDEAKLRVRGMEAALVCSSCLTEGGRAYTRGVGRTSSTGLALKQAACIL